jgi:hypothetical protein
MATRIVDDKKGPTYYILVAEDDYFQRLALLDLLQLHNYEGLHLV